MQAREQAAFVRYDVSAFPVVRFDPGRARAGYRAPWASEMDALLARGRPFVVTRLCRAIVGVEPSAVVRAARRAQAAVWERALGIERIFVATVSEAARARAEQP